MFWQSSNSRILAFGASAEPYSSLRVASFYFDPTQQTFDCMFNTTVGLHRYHQASLGVSDVVSTNGEYIVAIDTPQNLKYVRFTQTELATCKVYCGDGLIEWDEWCDDGNNWNGDGCSSWCTTEPGWVCRFPGTPCN
jgi:cysteine-rich repeat protein